MSLEVEAENAPPNQVPKTSGIGQTGDRSVAAGVCGRYPLAGAYVLYLRQHARERIGWLEASVGVARRLHDRAMEGAALGNLGVAYAALGETRRAIEFHEQALEIAREIGDRRGESAALGNLGIAYAALGETRRAIELYDQRLEIAREIGDRRGEGISLYNLGDELAEAGERGQAIARVQEALEIFEEIEAPFADEARALLARLKSED